MDRNLMRVRSTLIFLAAAGSLLGACHKGHEQPPENQAVENSTPAPQPSVPPPAAKPVEKPARKVALKAATAPKPTADEQMLDDADATGMTSHAPHDPDTSDASGNSQP